MMNTPPAPSRDFTADDLITVLWMPGTASHDPAAPAGWRRVVDRSIASAVKARRDSSTSTDPTAAP